MQNDAIYLENKTKNPGGPRNAGSKFGTIDACLTCVGCGMP